MFSFESKYFIGLAVLTSFALIISLALFDELALSGVALSMLIVALSLIVGVLITTRSSDTVAEIENDVDVPPSIWPLLTGLGVVLLFVGTATSGFVSLLGFVILIGSLVEWAVQAWSEGSSSDAAYNTFARKRLLNPIEFPILAAVGLGLVVFMFSRIMLSVVPTLGASLFILIGAMVLLAGSIFSIRRNMTRGLTLGICACGIVAIIGGGIGGQISGMRSGLVNAGHEAQDTNAKCGPGRSEHFDKAPTQNVSMRSSVIAVISYVDGHLIAKVDGIVGEMNTITIGRSNPTNIIFRNDSQGEVRLVASLGQETTADGKSQNKVVCTQMTAPGSEQSLTFVINKPTSTDNIYSLQVAGVDDQQIELLVP